MAYWGDTMTHNRPIWMEQNSQVARAVLTRLGANAAERASRVENCQLGQKKKTMDRRL